MPLLVALLLLFATNCLATVTIDGEDSGSIDLSNSIRYLEDDDNRLSLGDIASIPSNHWTANDGNTFSQGYSNSTWWLAFDLENTTPNATKQMLQIGYPSLDHMVIHILQDGMRVNTFVLGDTLPFSYRPMKTHHFVVPITIPPESTLSFFVEVQSKSAVQVPLMLWQPDLYYRHDRTTNLLQGFYFGVMIVMTIYNLFVFIAVREKNFLLYVCFAFSLPMFIAGIKGYSFEYLWPNHPQWNEMAIIWPLCLAVFFGALFTESFLKIKQLGQWAVYLFRIQQACILLLLLLSHLLEYQLILSMLIPATTVSCILGLLFGIIMWNRSGLSAKYYTIGWSAFLVGGISLGMNKLGFIPANLITENTLQIGSSIEVILLSFALAESINEERRMRSEAQDNALTAERETRQAKEQALRIQQQTTEELEIRVQERTSELEALNRQLAELSDTDQLTGLKNRRYLDRVMKEEIIRCSRYHRELSVILLDVDHFKQFNDCYGHLIGDKCLKNIASSLNLCIRDSVDCLARYGGEEFCVMMPETSSECAMEAAERLREQINAMSFTVQGEEVPVSISLGVACLLKNERPSIEKLVSRADEALYEAKQAGRNRSVLAALNQQPSTPGSSFVQDQSLN